MAIYVLKGLFKNLPSNPKSLIGLVDFTKILKPILQRLGITYADSCCPTTGFSTVRYNTTTGQVEYLSNPQTGTYTAGAAPTLQQVTAAGSTTTVASTFSTLTLSAVPTFANDAAAIAGGLTSGKLYKTTTAGITALNILP